MKSNEDELASLIDKTHDLLLCGDPDAGIGMALAGARMLRDAAAETGCEAARAMAERAGLDAGGASAAVALSESILHPLPSPLVDALIEARTKTDEAGIRKAVCSRETGAWVVGPHETFATTAELLERVGSEKNASASFVGAVAIAVREAKARFVGRTALHMLSGAFAADFASYRAGSCEQEARDMFERLERMESGISSDEDGARFAAALSACIERSLSLRNDGAWGIGSKGPSAVASLPSEQRRMTVGVLFATADESRRKSMSVAEELRLCWDDVATGAEKVRVFFVANPIAPCDASLLLREDLPLATIGADIARLQAAAPLLMTLHKGVVRSLMDGTAEAEGLFFSTGRPFVLGKDLMEETVASIRRIVEHGALSPTPRGRATLGLVMRAVWALAMDYPEHCPWFSDGDDSMVEWLNDCQWLLLEDVKTLADHRALRRTLRDTQSAAIAMRDEEEAGRSPP